MFGGMVGLMCSSVEDTKIGLDRIFIGMSLVLLNFPSLCTCSARATSSSAFDPKFVGEGRSRHTAQRLPRVFNFRAVAP
eukprot:542533-Amphidinium_carterae.1